GNGAAGATAAEEIRKRDPRGHIVIVGAEPYPMYSRPGLAYVITHQVSDTQVIARKMEWYEQNRITLIHGRAVRLDSAARTVALDDGRTLQYDRLLIASGARAVPLPNPGATLDGVVYLDTLDGTKELMHKAKSAKKAVVIGGGITALELAEGLAHQGIETHYFVRKDSLWSAVFNETESKLLETRMIGHGVIIHYNTEISEVIDDGAGRVAGVRLTTGEALKCEIVGAAIGVKPSLDFVQGSSLKMDRAILVTEYLETNLPGVYAAGDCAQIWDRWSKKHLQDVLWPSAIASGRAAGANMAGAREAFVKGVPFNACLLFGLHITAMGQLGGRDGDDVEVVQHLDRGSSQVWATRPAPYASAWTQDGDNTMRLVLSDDHLVGALIVGEQTLADPLRYIIEKQIDARALRPYLRSGGAVLKQRLQQFWQSLRVTETGGVIRN
ncbi:MAG: FAD-dependent oxidoreductase, partial [Chloroflexota bacterium]